MSVAHRGHMAYNSYLKAQEDTSIGTEQQTDKNDETLKENEQHTKGVFRNVR